MSGVIQSQTIHLVSALGCDSTIYCNIELQGTVNHVEWLTPQNHEPLDDYCTRLIEVNNIVDGDVVIGVSFGGIVATQITKQVKTRKTIVVSSISYKAEKPFKYKFMNVFKHHRAVPKAWLNDPGKTIGRTFGKVTDEEYAMLSKQISNVDVDLARWSIDQMMRFDNDSTLNNIIKIHGTDDKVFPYTQCDYLLDGNHLIIYNNPCVNNIINSII